MATQKTKTTRKRARGEGLKAYNEMRKRLKEQEGVDPKEQKASDERRLSVQRALEEPEDAIVKSLAETKLQVAKALDEVAQRRVEQHKKLVELEGAIAAESKKLEELHEIAHEAETLTALMSAQEEQREAFEKEMAEVRTRWDKERAAVEEEIEVRRSRVERERKQEEEEYAYNQKKSRQAEVDGYEARKAALEKELASRREQFDKDFGEREVALKSQEQELHDLRAKSASFPAQLEKAVGDAEKSARERAEFLFKHQAEILKKETDGERKLHAHAVAALEAKIAEKDALIAQLTQKANEAGNQVQDIALKAIDGASRLRVIREEWQSKEGASGGRTEK